MNNWQERPKNLRLGNILCSVPGRSALVILSSLLCFSLLVLNVRVGLAQAQPSDLKQRKTNISRLDKARRLAYHTRFLRQVAKSGSTIEVVWNIEKVFPSLRFIAENGSEKDNDAARAIGSIFSRTEDIMARDLCLSALKRIGNKVAKREMMRIYNDPTVPAEWRTACAEYLKVAPPRRLKAAARDVSVDSVIDPLRKP